MIYYFSGTGNTAMVAEAIAAKLGGVPELISHICPPDVQFEGSDAVFLFPVYAWGVPPIMIEFIRELAESEIEKMRNGRVRVWCVATCGDETGMAVEMFRTEFRRRGVELSGAWSVITPNVYVLLPGFDVDSKEVEEKKLEAIKGRANEIAGHILNFSMGDPAVEDVHVGPWPRLKTRLVYPLFKKWGIDWRKWKSGRECIGCGKCEEVCPVGNIVIDNGRPVWGSDCTSCLGCYHVCPVHAVRYGKMTDVKGQYRRGFGFPLR